MQLIKQDMVYVPVKVEDEMPPKGKKVSISFDNGKDFSYEATGKDWSKDEVNYTHWLKPVKNVYVLSEEELSRILLMYEEVDLKEVTSSDFIQSISKNL